MTREQKIVAHLRKLGAYGTALRICGPIPVTKVLSKCNLRTVTRLRHEVWTVVGDTLGYSYPETAALFDVDHTSVMSAAKKRRGP